MGLMDRLTIFGVLRSLLAEVRDHNALMRELVDELRVANGRLPKYAAPSKADPSEIAFMPGIIDPEDFATAEFLREYARAQGIGVSDLDDVQGLALEQGWIDEQGRILIPGGPE